MAPFSDRLPVDDALPRLARALSSGGNVVLSAPPGAGKTTRVPLALLDESWMRDKKILMLEPRRLAARRAAEYISAVLHEPVGRTVGYRIRGEAKVGTTTRIEIVTEGILSRMLRKEQDLPGVALVIFDEFHERSIHADLGLAFTLDVQRHLRPDLRVLVMSATLDGIAVADLLGDAPLIESEGRMFAVETRYASSPSDQPVEKRTADAIERAMRSEEGDILVFLPGQREIRRTEERLLEKRLPEDTVVHLLYGDADPQQQHAALTPDPIRRKIILSTSIAETSLTIDGVRIVIDSGLSRTVRFEPRRGMTGLVTVPVSRAAADQRRGRAGRQQAGVCFRLWTEKEHDNLPAFAVPEIKATDLTHLALDLASWGDPFAAGLRFLDPPPRAHLEQARELLRSLGALDDVGQLTAHGRAMAELPIHPRLAHMILRGKELEHGALACDLAALLEERDSGAGRRDEDVDLNRRWHSLTTARGSERGMRDRVERQSQRLRELTGVRDEKRDEHALALLLGLAYPDRVAKRKEGTERYQMAGGSTATLPLKSMLSRHEFLAIGDVDGIGADVRAYLASPLTAKDIELIFEDSVRQEEDVHWDTRAGIVVTREVVRAGAIILSERAIGRDSEKVVGAMIAGVRGLGLETLPWNHESESFVMRSEWLRRHGTVSTDWPDLSRERLMKTLEAWLGPFLAGVWKKEQLSKIPLLESLKAQFSSQQLRDLERSAPSHIVVPSGSRLALDYSGSQPSVAVKLQEMFGQTETPTIAGGRVNVVVHLLSPAKRPLAVTQDLSSFWKNTYPKLRVQMRSEYPRHPWPEDPLTAVPTKRTVKRT